MKASEDQSNGSVGGNASNDEILLHAKKLIDQLEGGRSHEAYQVIAELNKARDINLFSEIGRLTRSLHDAMSEFYIDINIDRDNRSEVSQIADAPDRLHYVIELTEAAANKTMDKVEETIPVGKKIQANAEELKPEWDKVLSGEIKPQEFRELHKKMGAFIDSTIESSQTVNAALSDILLAQDYQDLTGQVIKRVISLVQGLETSLVDLVKMAASVEQIVGITPPDLSAGGIDAKDVVPEGPVVNAKSREDVVSGQDDVDDLLSSLGF
ncbi:MAG: protein phosphatase CheZ [Gammaproteobacteria bacterium]|nr:protein phosphatase CheZ [Gammaproteobacteria bacterium]